LREIFIEKIFSLQKKKKKVVQLSPRSSC
jgi:hypothetical protein